jgi:hypothetical protein
MRKIGEAFLFWVLVWVALPAQAQTDITVTASVNTATARQGDRIALSVVVSGSSFNQVNRPQLPAIAGLSLQNPQPQMSTNYRFVNGVSSRSHTLTYVYRIERGGSITIPSLTVPVDGTDYTTKPITLSVQEAGDRPAESSEEFFVRMELSSNRPVVGQQILAELTLYFKPGIDIVSFTLSNNWRTDGFWKESLNDGATPRAEETVLNGERFRKAILSRHALFPNRSGDLTIGEQTVSLTVRNTSRFQDPFNAYFGNQRSVDVASRSIPVSVRALPEVGTDDGMPINAVGDFTVTRRVVQSVVGVGEAVELVTEVTGAGNLALISKPVYELPEGFERFQPSDEVQLTRTPTQVTGTRTFRDVLIARRAGDYAIAATAVAVFDPQTARYRRIPLAAIGITVNRDAAAGRPGAYDGERRLTLAPIAVAGRWTRADDDAFGGWWWFGSGLLLPLLALGAAKRWKNERDRLRSDHAYYRKTHARSRAEATLATISDAEEVKASFAKLHRALSGFVADRLDLPEAGLEDATLTRHLTPYLDADELAIIRQFLDRCASIRFAPTQSRSDLVREFTRVQSLLKRLDSALP